MLIDTIYSLYEYQSTCVRGAQLFVLRFQQSIVRRSVCHAAFSFSSLLRIFKSTATMGTSTFESASSVSKIIHECCRGAKNRLINHREIFFYDGRSDKRRNASNLRCWQVQNINRIGMCSGFFTSEVCIYSQI
jgi:hypothetical protein